VHRCEAITIPCEYLLISSNHTSDVHRFETEFQNKLWYTTATNSFHLRTIFTKITYQCKPLVCFNSNNCYHLPCRSNHNTHKISSTKYMYTNIHFTKTPSNLKCCLHLNAYQQLKWPIGLPYHYTWYCIFLHIFLRLNTMVHSIEHRGSDRKQWRTWSKGLPEK